MITADSTEYLVPYDAAIELSKDTNVLRIGVDNGIVWTLSRLKAFPHSSRSLMFWVAMYYAIPIVCIALSFILFWWLFIPGTLFGLV